MARITTSAPAPGKPLTRGAAMANVSSNWITLLEADDYSVPDASGQFAVRDPTNAARAIRPGQVFFLTPLFAYNKTGVERWFEVRFLYEDGTTVMLGRFMVRANDVLPIPVQGRSLVKRNAAGSNGDRLQIRAEQDNVFDASLGAQAQASVEDGKP